MTMQNFKDFLGKGRYFLLGVLATSFVLGIHTTVRAQAAAADSGAPGNALSPIVILFLVIGLVISILYIKAMLTVLHEASNVYAEEDEEADGNYYSSPAWGAALAGALSAVVIWSYGVSPVMLYLGPILSMISPIAILYCMMQDIKEFKANHSAVRQSTTTEELTGMRG